MNLAELDHPRSSLLIPANFWQWLTQAGGKARKRAVKELILPMPKSEPKEHPKHRPISVSELVLERVNYALQYGFELHEIGVRESTFRRWEQGQAIRPKRALVIIDRVAMIMSRESVRVNRMMNFDPAELPKKILNAAQIADDLALHRNPHAVKKIHRNDSRVIHLSFENPRRLDWRTTNQRLAEGFRMLAD